MDFQQRLDLLLPYKDLDSCWRAFDVYWSRWKLQFPDHDVFNLVPKEALQFTCPIKLHGDEGRSALTMAHLVGRACYPKLSFSLCRAVCAR